MRALPLALALLVLAASPAAAEHAPDPAIDLSFPVAGPVVYGDDWHASRGNRGLHRAQDLEGARLQRIHAAVGGTVCDFAAEQRRVGGYELAICGDDGRRYAYSHFNNDTPGSDDGRGGPASAYAPRVAPGARVARGQWLGWMGDSGNAEAEGPQLHFHIQTTLTDPDTVDGPLPRLDPLPSLLVAKERGDVPAQVTALQPQRAAGVTRLETAVAVSQRVHESGTAVVIAPSASPLEALRAAPLAALRGAPVLLSDAGGLSAAARGEVTRLRATEAVLIGRPDQLSAGVEADLAALGVSVSRVEAPDPATMSALLAREVAPEGPAEVLLARGLGDPERAWPDALSAGALAAHLRAPILLTAPDTLPRAVQDYLAAARPGAVHAIGGVTAVSDETVDRARAVAGAGGRRLAGEDRYGTSAAVAAAAFTAGLDAGMVWLATGRAFPDALAAGPAAAASGAPVLLLDGQVAGGARDAEAWLMDTATLVEALVVVGGETAVSAPVAAFAGELAAH